MSGAPDGWEFGASGDFGLPGDRCPKGGECDTLGAQEEELELGPMLGGDAGRLKAGDRVEAFGVRRVVASVRRCQKCGDLVVLLADPSALTPRIFGSGPA